MMERTGDREKGRTREWEMGRKKLLYIF